MRARARGKILLLGRRHAAGGLKIAGCFSAFKNDLLAGFVEIDLKDLVLTYFIFFNFSVALIFLIIVLRLFFFFVRGASEIASFYSSHEKEANRGSHESNTHLVPKRGRSAWRGVTDPAHRPPLSPDLRPSQA